MARYLPAFDNERSGTITVEQLLRHEAGFSQPGYPERLGEYSDLRAAVDAVGHAGPPAPPDQRFEYSDAGSATLGALVAEITGAPAEDFIERHIVGRLGLSHTMCNLTEDDERRPLVSCTYSKGSDGFEKYWDQESPQQVGFFRASGGMYSTAVDYARFLAATMDGDLLPRARVDAAIAPSARSRQGTRGYGMHWESFGEALDGGRPVFGHSGSDGTMAVADPERDVIFCYFTQSRGGRTLRDIPELVDAALPQATSLAGTPLFAPRMSGEVEQERKTQLTKALGALRDRPEGIDELIWFGRRSAYLGQYRRAVKIFSRALQLHPDEPRLLRHRGHRNITLRRFDAATADLARAAELIEGQDDRVEPDGLPNARNIPTSTLQSNIWYHLGLAHYLRADFESALTAYRACLQVSRNPDMLCATTHWAYMTLRRLGRDAEAAELLAPIHAEMDVIENHGYHHLLLMYRGERSAEQVLASVSGTGGIQGATVAYGVANWHLYNDRPAAAVQLFEQIVAGPQWPAFGHIAAEAELARN